MPKIRCQGCQTVLNAPESARGKVIACPKCSTKLKVPAGSAAAPQQKKQDQPVDFGSLDLDRLSQTGEQGAQICPYCAAELDPEDPVCRGCGMNVQTGQMDRAEQRRRSIKGPDPREFYKNAWKGSWEFLLENTSIAVRTGLFWWLFATMNAICAYMSFVYCKTWPTQLFWGSLMLMSASGIPGWFLYVILKVIMSSITREPFRQDRVHFDFFQAVAGGTRTVFWPLVVIGPFLPLTLLIYLFLLLTDNPLAFNTWFLFGAVAVIQALPIMVLPIALVHMTTKHTYKAWILWELLQIFVKNVGPSLYLLFISVLAFVPTLLLAGGIFFFLGATNPLVSEVLVGGPTGEDKFSPGLTGNIALWLMKLLELGTAQDSVYYTIIKGLINVAATAIVMAPITFSAGFPAVFVMKATGLFGYYQNRSLDLVPRIMPGTPATFWVRYLAHTVDRLFIPLTSFLVTANPKAMMVGWAVNGFSILIWLFSPNLLPLVAIVLPFYTSWMYWAVQESSQLRSTLGKDTFGLMVETEDDKTLTLKQATFKWFLRELWFFSFGLPFLLAAFHPEKRALHDLVTRTKVVFRGDK